VLSEEQTEDVQEETTVKDMPDSIITKAQFVELFLDLSDIENAGSEVVTNPLAGIESRAGAFIENLYSWIEMELKQKTQQVKHLPRGSIDDHM